MAYKIASNENLQLLIFLEGNIFNTISLLNRTKFFALTFSLMKKYIRVSIRKIWFLFNVNFHLEQRKRSEMNDL